MDGPPAPIACVSEAAYMECTDEKTCAIRGVMKQVRDAIANIVDNTTLAVVSKSPKLKKQMLALNFFI
jgi:DNA-binding IscR family transcriptional regulator